MDSIRESLSGHLGNKSYLGETTIRASGHGQPSWLAMAGLNFVSGLPNGSGYYPPGSELVLGPLAPLVRGPLAPCAPCAGLAA